MKTLSTFAFLMIFAIIFISCGEKSSKVLEGKSKKEIISLAPKVPGRILKIRINEGQIVRKGDTLLEISVPEVEAKILQAEGALFAADNQYQMAVRGATQEEKNQVTAIYNTALEQFQFAEKTYQRISKMFKDSLVTGQQYDEVLAKFNSARLQLEAAKSKKDEVLGGIRNEKINITEGQKKQAQGAYREAQVAYSERFIIAPKDMTIETIALHEGELALPGYNIIVGYDVHSVYFRFTVPESKLMEFKRNNEYEIELPFSKKTVKGKLVSVKELAKYAYKTSSYPNYQLGESVYELRIEPINFSADSIEDNFIAILKHSL